MDCKPEEHEKLQELQTTAAHILGGGKKQL